MGDATQPWRGTERCFRSQFKLHFRHFTKIERKFGLSQSDHMHKVASRCKHKQNPLVSFWFQKGTSTERSSSALSFQCMRGCPQMSPMANHMRVRKFAGNEVACEQETSTHLSPVKIKTQRFKNVHMCEQFLYLGKICSVILFSQT